MSASHQAFSRCSRRPAPSRRHPVPLPASAMRTFGCAISALRASSDHFPSGARPRERGHRPVTPGTGCNSRPSGPECDRDKLAESLPVEQRDRGAAHRRSRQSLSSSKKLGRESAKLEPGCNSRGGTNFPGISSVQSEQLSTHRSAQERSLHLPPFYCSVEIRCGILIRIRDANSSQRWPLFPVQCLA